MLLNTYLTCSRVWARTVKSRCHGRIRGARSLNGTKKRGFRTIYAGVGICSGFAFVTAVFGQELVSFPTADGGRIYADVYGTGANAVVLAHGGQFDKESWAAQARTLADAGYLVLALDFRGYGDSTGPGDGDPLAAPLHLDILGAEQYLRTSGAESIAVVGGSMGGSAAADAAVNSDGFSRLVLLGSGAGAQPAQIGTPTLFLLARDDLQFNGTPRLVGIQADYDEVRAPKELMLFDGSAHAQFLFDGPEGEAVMAAILAFLSER